MIPHTHRIEKMMVVSIYNSYSKILYMLQDLIVGIIGYFALRKDKAPSLKRSIINLSLIVTGPFSPSYPSCC